MNTLIIVGFYGVGKSYLQNQYDNDTLLLPLKIKSIDEEKYRYYRSGLINLNFPTNYINEIHDVIEDCDTDVLLLPYTQSTLHALSCIGCKYLIVYPDESDKDTYMDRYRQYNRGNEFIHHMKRIWSNEITRIESMGSSRVYTYKMEHNEFLSDAMCDILVSPNLHSLFKFNKYEGGRIKKCRVGKRRKKKT